MATRKLEDLLDKTTNYDKDERWMATSDLCTYIQNNHNTTSQHDEARIVNAILKRLRDDSSDVQAVAVRTLTTFYTICGSQWGLISMELIGQMLEGDKPELRDVYSNGLKKLLEVLADGSSGKKDIVSCRKQQAEVVEGLLDPLLKAIKSTNGEDDKFVALYSLEVLTDLIGLFGSTQEVIRQKGEEVTKILLDVIGKQEEDLSKRAMVCLGQTCKHLPQKLVERTVESLVREVRKSESTKTRSTSSIQHDVATFVRALAVLAEHCGSALGTKTEIILSILLHFVQNDESSEDEEDEDEEMVKAMIELRVSSFGAIESLIRSNASSILIEYGNSMFSDSADKIITSCISYMKYDPNYFDDGSDEEMDDEYEDEDDAFSDADFEGEEEDDDESWKLRRAAIQTASVIIDHLKDSTNYQKELVRLLWGGVGDESSLAYSLITRLKKEREAHVQHDVVATLDKLMRYSSKILSTNEMCNEITEGVYSKIPNMISICTKAISNKKAPSETKIGCLHLLRSTNFINTELEMSSAVKESLFMVEREPQQKIKYAALELFSSLIASSRAKEIMPDLCDGAGTICDIINVKGEWYKIVALGLSLLGSLCVALKEKKIDSNVIDQIYNTFKSHASKIDCDQEIREKALPASSACLIAFHNELDQNKIEDLVRIIIERVKSGGVRLAAVRSLSTLTCSNDVDLSSVYSDIVTSIYELLQYEQKSSESSKQLRQAALETLASLAPKAPEGTPFDDLVVQLALMIKETDLSTAHLSITAAHSILSCSPGIGPVLSKEILPAVLELSASPLLMNHTALSSILQLLTTVVKKKVACSKDIYALMDKIAIPERLLNKSIVHNVAKCYAVVGAVSEPEDRELLCLNVKKTLESCASDTLVQMGLITLGELGQRFDTSGDSAEVLSLYFKLFDADSEETKNAAAYGLGHVTVGGMDIYCPLVLDAFEKEQEKKKKYLLLSSLKEVISFYHKSNEVLSDKYVSMIEPHLHGMFSSDDAGVTTLVSECMGKLAVLHPTLLLPRLKSIIGETSYDEDSPGTRKCVTALSSVKCAISSHISYDDIVEFMPTFFGPLKGNNLELQIAALRMTYACTHHLPALADYYMEEYISPAVSNLSVISKKRTIDLGPFKSTIDDALPLRSTSISIFTTCMKNCPSKFDLPAYMPGIAMGISDDREIQMHTFAAIQAFSSKYPEAFVSAADSFVKHLQVALKNKSNLKGSELERWNEMIKSCIKTIMVLYKLDGISSASKFVTFAEQVKNDKNCGTKWREME